jgi:hypothetical protein
LLSRNTTENAVNAPDFKDISAVLPLLAAIFTYYSSVKARADWIREKVRRLGPLGSAHWWIDALPNHILVFVSLIAAASSLAYFGYKLFVLPTDTHTLAKILEVNYDNFYFVFFGWLVFAVIGFFNGIARFFVWLAGLVPKVRSSLGFANASWHIERGDKAFALTWSQASGRALAEGVVSNLATAPPNPNLALRPAEVTDAEAANILYFGHVVEQFYADAPAIKVGATGWTLFYHHMGGVARSPDHPFSVETLRAFTGNSFFYEVLKRYELEAAGGSNSSGDGAGVDSNKDDVAPSLPDSQQLEQSVDAAFGILQERLGCDARRLGRRWFGGYSYATSLRAVDAVLHREELRRQFAKLAVIWRIWGDRYARPKKFRIPFSRGILVLLLDKRFVQTDADELNLTDERVIACSERCQEQILGLAFDALERTNNPKVVTWRDNQKANASSMRLDWPWYALYRIDQHIYHMGRTHKPESWEAKPERPVIAKKKSKVEA